MTVTLVVCGLLFGIGALFASIRLVRGPTQIDRAVALDVLLAILVGVIVLIVWWATDGHPSENQHGPSPKYQAAGGYGY